MKNEILATSATLHTLSVSIEALVVEGKQMTLAVFRQLPSIHAIDEDGRLQPFRFWGKVLYKIKDEGDEWAVAEMDGKLCRCRILNPADAEKNQYRWDISYARRHNDAKEIERLTPLFAKDNACGVNRRQSYEKLQSLPQLFIAV